MLSRFLHKRQVFTALRSFRKQASTCFIHARMLHAQRKLVLHFARWGLLPLLCLFFTTFKEQCLVTWIAGFPARSMRCDFASPSASALHLPALLFEQSNLFTSRKCSAIGVLLIYTFDSLAQAKHLLHLPPSKQRF